MKEKGADDHGLPRATAPADRRTGADPKTNSAGAAHPGFHAGGYVQGTSEPDFATLKLLSAYFGVTADYLPEYPTGAAETPEETELIRVFRSLTPEQQRIFLEQGKIFVRYNAAIGKADKGRKS